MIPQSQPNRIVRATKMPLTLIGTVRHTLREIPCGVPWLIWPKTLYRQISSFHLCRSILDNKIEKFLLRGDGCQNPLPYIFLHVSKIILSRCHVVVTSPEETDVTTGNPRPTGTPGLPKTSCHVVTLLRKIKTLEPRSCNETWQRDTDILKHREFPSDGASQLSRQYFRLTWQDVTSVTEFQPHHSS